MLFKEYFRSHTPELSIKGVMRRHRKPIPGALDYDRKHLNIVPAKYRVPQNSNHKIETLKKHPGRFVCDGNDVKYIINTFLKGVAPSHDEFKTLGGKLGIKFYFDRGAGKWVVEKS